MNGIKDTISLNAITWKNLTRLEESYQRPQKPIFSLLPYYQATFCAERLRLW